MYLFNNIIANLFYVLIYIYDIFDILGEVFKTTLLSTYYFKRDNIMKQFKRCNSPANNGQIPYKNTAGQIWGSHRRLVSVFHLPRFLPYVIQTLPQRGLDQYQRCLEANFSYQLNDITTKPACNKILMKLGALSISITFSYWRLSESNLLVER